MRGRGLKLVNQTLGRRSESVAPRAGARIETATTGDVALSSWVAPRAGARIETFDDYGEITFGGCRPPCGGAD